MFSPAPEVGVWTGANLQEAAPLSQQLATTAHASTELESIGAISVCPYPSIKFAALKESSLVFLTSPGIAHDRDPSH